MHAAQRSSVNPLLRQALSGAKMLSAERERELLLQYHQNNDQRAIDELVRSHMPIIFRAAGRSAKNPGIDINDLVQTATEGLLIAISRWSFEKSDGNGLRLAGETDQSATAPRSSRLATYAMWWMRILLTDSVIESRGMVVRAKSHAVRKALFALPSAIRALDISLPLAGDDVSRIAAHLGVAEHEIQEALIHAAGDVMLDEPIGDGNVSRGDLMADDRGGGEDGLLNRITERQRWGGVCSALLHLPPRDRFILITRYLLVPKWKLDRLSDTLQMSRERLRQIADQSLTRIQRALSSPAKADVAEQEEAVARIEALVSAIEQASSCSDPRAMTLFLAEYGVPIGPTRGTPGRPRKTASSDLLMAA